MKQIMDFNELIQTYHLKLNEQQKKAVLETNGSLLLLAVPRKWKDNSNCFSHWIFAKMFKSGARKYFNPYL